MELILFISIGFGFHVIIRASSEHYCVRQPETLRVTEGESVTIPCAYSNPVYSTFSPEYRLDWRDSKNEQCWSNITRYNSFEDFTGAEYQGRTSRRKNSDSNKTGSITIQGIRKTDGPRICCYLLDFRDKVLTYSWGTFQGTTLLFPDEIWVDQMEALPAVPGENLTIPCYINYPHNNSDITKPQVTWFKGEKCDKQIHVWDSAAVIGRFSLVSFPTDPSLHIENVQTEDAGRYCCSIYIHKNTYQLKHGTELVIPGTNSLHRFNISQPQELLSQKGNTSIITCSFTPPQDRDLLNLSIYWRAGSPRGAYAYHPNKEMIDPHYKDRTELKGNLDLHIMNVQEADETSYYCFVMLTLCNTTSDYKSVIDHGRGTKLTVTGSFGDSHIIVFASSVVLLIVIIILCGILICLKKRGIICKKKEKISVPPANDLDPQLNGNVIYDEMTYLETKTEKTDNEAQVEEEEEKSRQESQNLETDDCDIDENGAIHYAKLNTFRERRNPSGPPKQEPEILYAAVKQND